MSWSKIPPESLPLVKQNYEQLGFCFETRLQLANFIETYFVDSNVDDATAMNIASQLLTELKMHIETNMNSPQMFTSKHTLQSTYQRLQENHTNDGLLDLFKIVVQCLEQENMLSNHTNDPAITSDVFSPPEKGQSCEIQERIGYLLGEVERLGVELGQIQQKQENYTMDERSVGDIRIKFEQKQIHLGEQNYEVRKLKKKVETFERAVQTKKKSLNNHLAKLFNELQTICEKYQTVQDVVLKQELMMWKKKQQQSGESDLNKLKKIQKWCDGLADIIWNMRQLVKQLEDLTHSMEAKTLLSKIVTLLKNLAAGTFIIEKQPQQVLRTSTSRFNSKVSLLIGRILLQPQSRSVKASIVPGEKVKDFENLKTAKQKEELNCGEIINRKGAMKYEKAKDEASTEFKNLMLKKIVREKGKRVNDLVTGEKFSIIFWMEFSVDNIEFQLCVSSLPICVICHDSQKVQALATIAWDSAGEESFVEKEDLPWCQIGEALSRKWNMECGKPLTEEHKYYLACKAFQDNKLDPNNFKQNILNWSKFGKESMPGQKFTFWEWFYSMLSLTQQHLEKLWKKGYVMGFVAKGKAQSFLLQQPQGTFLLRFSDSILGGVAIAHRKESGMGSKVEIVAPFTKDDLGKRGIIDVFFDLCYLTQLYQNYPGSNIPLAFFQQFRQKKEEETKGYVARTLVWTCQKSGNDPHTAQSPDGNQTPLRNIGVTWSSEPEPNVTIGDLEKELDTIYINLDGSTQQTGYGEIGSNVEGVQGAPGGQIVQVVQELPGLQGVIDSTILSFPAPQVPITANQEPIGIDDFEMGSVDSVPDLTNLINALDDDIDWGDDDILSTINQNDIN